MGLMDLYFKKGKDSLIKKNITCFRNDKGFQCLSDNDAKLIAEELMSQFKKIEFKFKDGDGYYNREKYEECPNKYKTPSEGSVLSNRDTFSATLINNKWYTKCEDVLERMIKLAYKYRSEKKEVLENQISIPDTKNASRIDLLRKDDETIELIELKQWDNANNPPTYAVAECIKNLYMFIHLYWHLYIDQDGYKGDKIIKNFKIASEKKHIKIDDIYNIKDIKNIVLTILAPEKYYADYFECSNKDILKKSFDTFCVILEKGVQEDLQKELGKSYNIQIKLKTIENFDKDAYTQLINGIINDYTITHKTKTVYSKRARGFTEQAEKISLVKYISDVKWFSDDMCNKLVNWESYKLK